MPGPQARDSLIGGSSVTALRRDARADKNSLNRLPEVTNILAPHNDDFAHIPKANNPLLNPKSKIRVLIVEDLIDVRTPIKIGLELSGFDVIEAECGKTAMEQVSHSPDVIIIDYGLPDITGLEVAARIRNLENGSKFLIAVLTGTDGTELRNEAKSVRCDGYFTKPLSILKLTKWINENISS